MQNATVLDIFLNDIRSRSIANIYGAFKAADPEPLPKTLKEILAEEGIDYVGE